MNIKRISADDLRQMKDSEALILQGCGGSLDEWVDGINDLLTESGILLEGTKFKAENCAAFEHDGLTCLMFPFSEDVKLDVGRLAMWRLQTHQDFGGTWLSDYVPNRVGGFIDSAQEAQKPDCPLIGQNGNIYNLIGIASRTLRQSGMSEQATKMCSRITETAGSYSEALSIIGEYVNITSVDDGQDYREDMEMGL